MNESAGPEKRRIGRPPGKVINADGFFVGDGFVRDKGNGLAVTCPKPEDMARPDTTAALAALSASQGSDVFPCVTHPLKRRLTKLAVLGIPSSILDAGSQEYARCVRLAAAYKKARTKEIFAAHGYVSSGVGALLASASLALSASRFLYEIGASTPIQPAERGDLTLPAILKLASSLSDSYRQNELSAWELAAREAVIRKRNATDTVQVPWMVSQSPNGETKRGPGRPRNVVLVQEEQNNG